MPQPARAAPGPADPPAAAAAAAGPDPPLSRTVVPASPDIEHYPVVDDPRLWSEARKWSIVATLSCGSWIPATSANILFPALPEIEQSLHTTGNILAMSVSLFILLQGCGSATFVPISELYGRRWIYYSTLAVFTLAQWVAGTAKSVGLFIAMRILGGYASSPLLTMAGATIAEMYAVEERATKISVYYSAPMLGPSVGSLLGGGLTSAGSWRYPFYFLGAAGGAILVTFFVFYRESFRKERSLVWHKARKRSLAEALAQDRQASSDTVKASTHHHEGRLSWWARCQMRLTCPKKKLTNTSRTRRLMQCGLKPVNTGKPPSASTQEDGGNDLKTTPQPDQSIPYRPYGNNSNMPSVHRVLSSGVESAALTSALEESHVLEEYEAPPHRLPLPEKEGKEESADPTAKGEQDIESQAEHELARTASAGSVNVGFGQEIDRIKTEHGNAEVVQVRVRLSDVNPLGPMIETLRQPHNVLSVLYSGLTFASQYSLSYTATNSFSSAPYSFDPVVVGLVLFALGVGGIMGSLIGGKLSDQRLRNLRLAGEAQADRDGTPFQPVPSEERLKMLFWYGLLVPLPFFGYAWMTDKGIHVAGPVVMLFFIGLLQFSCYSVFLAYIVDANKGRSSAAVSANSCFRGACACVGSQISGPLQRRMGTGWMITGWGFVLIVAQLLLMTVAHCGTDWRQKRLERLRLRAEGQSRKRDIFSLS